MFGNIKVLGGKSPDKFDKTAELNAFIGQGTEFDGTLTFVGTIRVEGTLRGEISAKDILIVGDHGVVEGNVEVDTIIITGVVRGTIRAARSVEITPPGRFYGDIETPKFILREGGIFEGNCKMQDIRLGDESTKFAAASRDTDHSWIKVVEKKGNGGV